MTATRKYYKTLAVLGGFFALFYGLRKQKPVVDFVIKFITTPYKRVISWVCNWLPFSVAELCWAALILFCIWYVVHCAHCIWVAKRWGVVWHSIVGGATIALSVYAGYTLLWGFNYYATTFEEQAGIHVQPISVQQLAQTTQLFVDRVNEMALQVPRNAQGEYEESPQEILARADTIYDALEQRYPFLAVPPQRPKGMFFSRIMSEINFTGVFFPFTGEANLNIDAPVCLLPSTIAHELAHVRNIAPEQTANFIAVLACETSSDAAYEYSGYLLGYIYLANALYGADREAWKTISDSLSVPVRTDLVQNNQYWKQFKSPAASAANTMYDGFLQSYHQEMGVKSYGAVVDLLVAYYAA